jgi:hypothetical protein
VLLVPCEEHFDEKYENKAEIQPDKPDKPKNGGLLSGFSVLSRRVFKNLEKGSDSKLT